MKDKTLLTCAKSECCEQTLRQFVVLLARFCFRRNEESDERSAGEDGRRKELSHCQSASRCRIHFVI